MYQRRKKYLTIKSNNNAKIYISEKIFTGKLYIFKYDKIILFLITSRVNFLRLTEQSLVVDNKKITWVRRYWEAGYKM